MTSPGKLVPATLKNSWDTILTKSSEAGFLATPDIAKIIFPNFSYSRNVFWRPHANCDDTSVGWREKPL